MTIFETIYVKRKFQTVVYNVKNNILYCRMAEYQLIETQDLRCTFTTVQKHNLRKDIINISTFLNTDSIPKNNNSKT